MPSFDSSNTSRTTNPEKARAAARAACAKYHAKHRDKICARLRANARVRYATNPEKIKAQNRKSRAANRAKILAQKRAYYAANRAQLLLKAAAWRAAHPEYVKAYQAAYRVTNPEPKKAAQRKRRAQKAGAAQITLTATEWRAIQDAYHHRCAYCGTKSKRLTQDHIVPLSRGGLHTFDNVVPACGPCNSKKGVGPPPHAVQLVLKLV